MKKVFLALSVFVFVGFGSVGANAFFWDDKPQQDPLATGKRAPNLNSAPISNVPQLPPSVVRPPMPASPVASAPLAPQFPSVPGQPPLVLAPAGAPTVQGFTSPQVASGQIPFNPTLPSGRRKPALNSFDQGNFATLQAAPAAIPSIPVPPSKPGAAVPSIPAPKMPTSSPVAAAKGSDGFPKLSALPTNPPRPTSNAQTLDQRVAELKRDLQSANARRGAPAAPPVAVPVNPPPLGGFATPPVTQKRAPVAQAAPISAPVPPAFNPPEFKRQPVQQPVLEARATTSLSDLRFPGDSGAGLLRSSRNISGAAVRNYSAPQPRFENDPLPRHSSLY